MAEYEQWLQQAHQRLVMQPGMSPAGEAYSDDCLAGYPAAVAATRTRLGLAYGNDPAQRLDVFLPAEGEGPWPALVFFHGGGWSNGVREWCAFMAPVLAERGVALVAPSYRLMPQVEYAECMADCAAAVAWMLVHAPALRLDAARWVVGGHSAGGQIAALLAVDPRWWRDAGVVPQGLRGCYAVSATFNRRNVNPAVGEAWLQPGPPEAVQPDSPLALAAGAGSDYLLAWGDDEHSRVATTGLAMAGRLQAAGRPVQTLCVPGGTHFSMHLDHADAHSVVSRQLAGWLAPRLATG